MISLFLSFALLATSLGDGGQSDIDAVRGVADKVLANYRIEFVNQKTGKVYKTPEEFPKSADIEVRNRFFDWHYTTGILNSALIQLTEITGDDKYVGYVKKQIEYPIANWKKVNARPTGTDWNPFYGLRRYDELDFVGTENGALMDLNRKTGIPVHEDLIERAAEHIRHGQERLADGTLVRETPEKYTLWADDLYMGLSFMVRYGTVYGDRKMIEDAVLQVDNFNKYLWCEKTGLYYHGWYCSRNTAAGFHWGRCNGWIIKATCELLDVLRPDSPEFLRIKGYLVRQIDALKKYQCEDGMWTQVLDNPKSYKESSATVLFAGAIAHAIVKGWIGEEYAPMAIKAWETIRNTKLGGGELHTVCIGTGIRNTEREYLDRESTDTDSHGTGLVISTGMEIIALKDYLEGRNICWTRPSFNSCSVELNSDKEIDGLVLEYRKLGSSLWNRVQVLPYFKGQPGYRTSITRLEEDTAYECRFRASEKQICSATFFTWQSDVPVAKTIVIDPDDVRSFPIRIKESGTAQGWVRYTAPAGKVFHNTGNRPTFLVENAGYVLLDGMEFKGPQIHDGVVSVKNSRGVRIQNCEMYDFGRIAGMAFDHKGVPQIDGKNVNFDGAILIKEGCSEVVVERCYIHDSAGRSNSWRYAHPAGTEAVIMYRPDHSTVIRYNAFIGSDLHRFNDAVESQGNFADNGGFNRDADIYGNFMCYTNDDCIELDGGQRNVRCFDNRFEGSLVGISIQGCMVSPSFVFNNILSGLGEEFGSVGRGLKTGGGKHGDEAKTYIYDNIWYNRCGGFDMMERLEAHLWNNTWGVGNKLTNSDISPRSTFENNRTEVKMQESDIPVTFPVNPCPFLLSESRKTDPADGYTIMIKALPSLTTEQPWEVRHNNDMDWFSVTPSSGVLHPGEEIALTLHLDAEKMKDRRLYRGAFIVRTPEGLSRPFTFYNNTSFVPPFKAEKKGDVAVYVDAFKPVKGKPVISETDGTEFGKVVKLPSNDVLCWEVKVRKSGRYYVMVRTSGMKNGYVEANVDSDELLKTQLMAYDDHMTWTILAPGQKQGNRISFYDWEAGSKHRIYMKKGPRTTDGFGMEGIVVTDNPLSFEPR